MISIVLKFIFDIGLSLILIFSTISYLKEFKLKKTKVGFYLFFIMNLSMLSYHLASFKIDNHYEISQNVCRGLTQKLAIQQAVEDGIYSSHCLKNKDKTIIILGESHYKGQKSKEIGHTLIEKFPAYAIEGADLEEMPIHSKYFLKFAVEFVYPVLGVFFKESTIKDAKALANNTNKKIYRLEEGDLSYWDKEYSTYNILRRDIVLTKRNLRMRDNLYKINQKENLIVAIVGMAHSKELAFMMKSKYGYKDGEIILNN